MALGQCKLLSLASIQVFGLGWLSPFTPLVVTTLPVEVLFVMVQRCLVAGLTAGALKS